MQTLRRLYVYAVVFVSLETVLWGAIGLVRSFVGGRSVGGNSLLAQALSLILVGIPVFLLHWWLAQRSALSQPGERSARLRAIFLYGALLATLIPVVNNALALLDRLLAGLFRLDPLLAPLGGGQTLSDNLIAIALNAIAAAYFYTVERADWKAVPLGDDFAETRRLYRYMWVVYGLVIAGVGLQRAVAYILKVFGPGIVEDQYLFTSGLALLVIGLPIWVYSWRLVQASLTEPGESSSRLRLALLYGLVFIAAAGTLFCAVVTIQTLLLYLLGERTLVGDLWAEASETLSAAIPLGAVWVYYGRILQAHIAGMDASASQQAALRRIYRYVLSLFGLFATFLGTASLLTGLTDLVVSGGVDNLRELREQFSIGIGALLVGLPVWVLHWRPMVIEAASQTETGDLARRSLVRRGYLYLALFAGVMGVMFTAGALLYNLISALLGEPPADLLLRSLQLFVTLLLFAALLAYHGLALRADGRLLERALIRRLAAYPVLVLAPDEDEFAETLVAALEREAPGLPVAVQPVSQGAPDETLSAAKAVVLPGGLLAKPPEALRLWLQAFDGQRIVLPTPADGWLWASGEKPGLPAQARRAARLIRRLAEGD